MTKEQNTAVSIMFVSLICDAGTFFLAAYFLPMSLALSIGFFGFLVWMGFWLYVDSLGKK